MTRSTSTRYGRRFLAMTVLAVLLLVAGVASRGAGAPFIVFFIFLGLMVVCLLAGFRILLVARARLREELSQAGPRTGLAQPRRDGRSLP
jgi:uncharacterized membrane protein